MLMTRHFDYCPSASNGDNQSVRSSAPVVSTCFPGGYNVKLYISRGRLAWWLLAFVHSVLVDHGGRTLYYVFNSIHFIRCLYFALVKRVNKTLTHPSELHVYKVLSFVAFALNK